MDYQHFLLHVRARQAELRAADERARLLRSAHASRRPVESPRLGRRAELRRHGMSISPLQVRHMGRGRDVSGHETTPGEGAKPMTVTTGSRSRWLALMVLCASQRDLLPEIGRAHV